MNYPYLNRKVYKELVVRNIMTIRRKIKKVVDGDTFQTYRKIRGTDYVRIAGIDAPEKGQPGYGVAKRRLSRLVGKTVTLTPKGRSYGRVVASVRYKRRKVR